MTMILPPPPDTPDNLEAADLVGLQATYVQGWEYSSALTSLRWEINAYEWHFRDFNFLNEELMAIWESVYRESVIGELERRVLSGDQEELLVATLGSLIQASETVPSKQRQVIDRAIYRILYRLQTPSAAPLAVRCIASRRKKLRGAGFRYFKLHELDDASIEALLRLNESHPDPEISHLFVQSPRGVRSFGPSNLLLETEDEYWRMRVLQTVMGYSVEDACSYASEYPMEFLWAVGRVGCRECTGTIRAMRSTFGRNPRFLSLSLWALSQMGEPSEFVATLQAARQLLSETQACSRHA